MTNLADLLPAGGGQNNTDFVADGNISAGAPVILTSDGKAAPISSSSADLGSEYQFEAARSLYIGTCFMGAPDNVVITTYRDNGNSGYGTAVVAQIYGNGLVSYGTPVVFNSASTNYTDCAWDENEHKIVVVFDNNGSSLGQGCVGTVSGVSISFGALASFNAAPTQYCQCAYDASDQKVIVVYTDQGNSSYATACAATISGTSVSWGTEYVIDSAEVGDQFGISYDSTAQKCVIGYKLASNGGYGVVATTSSGAISFGTKTKFTDYIDYTRCAYDAAANKTIIAYTDAGTGTPKVIAGTVSGTDISFGAATAYGGAGAGWHNDISYNSYASKCVLLYGDASDSYKAKIRETTISGTTVTVSDATTVNTNGTNWHSTCPSVYGSVYRTYLAVDDEDDSDGVGYGYQPSQTTLTSTNLLGLAPEAISDTATGTINTLGSRCENNDFFGTVSATYGSPTAASAYQSEAKVLAYDSANNRFVMAYKDGSNSDYGTAVVGELSGTSITWGTPVVFESATTGSAGMDIAFDSNVNRIVIAYQDQENSSYGTAIVGSVSGTGSGSTIAFGSPTIFESASTQYLSMTFDSNDNRIVIVYADAGNSFYATYVIGTVTTGPDAISFNTPALLNGSSATYEIDASFDATENKVLVAYTDSSYDLYVLNLAISSGSGTPGTASSFGIGSPQQRFPRCVYDSVNGKSGVAYAEGTNLPIYFSVISMSGSNVTIETRVLAGDTSDSNYFMHNIAFDASSGQLAICTRDASASKGIAYYGSISGTTSSWTTSGSLFADETILTYGVDVAYDTSANKLAFVYSPSSGSDSAAVVGTLATTTLTIGTDYYVQTDGTLSTDTGGQLIGNAIKTNQINIKDYTG